MFLFYASNDDYAKSIFEAACLCLRADFIQFLEIPTKFVIFSFFSYRLYLHYHSLEQVVIGLIFGIFFGAVWFYVVDNVCTPLFQEIANT